MENKTEKRILDFIEIGTSDFETIIQQCDDTQFGISIEPIKKYLDNLPDRKNVQKINCAIVDDEEIKSAMIYYVEESVIHQNGFGPWLKGCNSVGKPHDFHLGYYPNPWEWHMDPNRHLLPKRNLLQEGLVEKLEIPCYTFKNLMEKYGIEYVNYIKIDTEGQDCKLLNSILDYYDESNKKLPRKILFETNAHNDINDIKEVCLRLEKKGYSMNGWDGNSFDALSNHDCLAELIN